VRWRVYAGQVEASAVERALTLKVGAVLDSLPHLEGRKVRVAERSVSVQPPESRR
jgi:hypothetical protein